MIFYTRQAPQVLTELQRNGAYTVKEEFIRSKYTTITDHYASLYRMLTNMARDQIDIPAGLLYPIWLTPEGTDTIPPSEDSVFLKLDIPDGYYVLANEEVWERMINHFYYPVDMEDELAFEAELARYGISSSSSLITGNAGNFYPLLKQRILNSWKCIYTVRPMDPAHLNGLCWELKREWIVD